jgi:hypothetical protein
MDGTGEIILRKLARLRRPKTACFLSGVKYRSNTNVTVL